MSKRKIDSEDTAAPPLTRPRPCYSEPGIEVDVATLDDHLESTDRWPVSTEGFVRRSVRAVKTLGGHPPAVHLPGGRATSNKNTTTTTFTCSTGQVDEPSIREQRPGGDRGHRTARPSNGDVGYALPNAKPTTGGDPPPTARAIESVTGSASGSRPNAQSDPLPQSAASRAVAPGNIDEDSRTVLHGSIPVAGARETDPESRTSSASKAGNKLASDDLQKASLSARRPTSACPPTRVTVPPGNVTTTQRQKGRPRPATGVRTDPQAHVTVTQKGKTKAATAALRKAPVRSQGPQAARGGTTGGSKCDKCKRTFDSPSLKGEHLRSAHPDGARKYICTKAGCGQGFKRKSTLTDHEATHTGQARFKCPWANGTDMCGKLFIQKGTLNVHVRGHERAFPFSCPKCFTKSANAAESRAHTCKSAVKRRAIERMPPTPTLPTSPMPPMPPMPPLLRVSPPQVGVAEASQARTADANMKEACTTPSGLGDLGGLSALAALASALVTSPMHTEPEPVVKVEADSSGYATNRDRSLLNDALNLVS